MNPARDEVLDELSGRVVEKADGYEVTVEGQTRALPQPFFVIATQNPHDQLGTYALPESQLDRFHMRISLGYPDRAAERELLSGADRRAMIADLVPCLAVGEIAGTGTVVPSGIAGPESASRISIAISAALLRSPAPAQKVLSIVAVAHRADKTAHRTDAGVTCLQRSEFGSEISPVHSSSIAKGCDRVARRARPGRLHGRRAALPGVQAPDASAHAAEPPAIKRAIRCSRVMRWVR